MQRRKVAIAGLKSRRRALNGGADKPNQRVARSKAGFWTVFGGIVATLSLVASFFVTPVNDFITEMISKQGPALVAEDVRQVEPPAQTFEMYFPRELNHEQLARFFEAYEGSDTALQEWHNTANKLARSLGGKQIGSVSVAKWNDGLNLSASSYHVNVVGNRNDTVRISSMRARILERKEPKGGTHLYEEPAGGNETDEVVVNLDSTDKRIQKVENGEVKPFLDTVNRYAETGEPLSFEVTAVTESCWCKWELVVDVAYDNESESIVIRSDGSSTGEPFETVPTSTLSATKRDNRYFQQPGLPWLRCGTPTGEKYNYGHCD